MPLPSGYTRLLYIKSFGAQYINTGFRPNQDTRIICKAVVPVDSTTRFLFGARTNGTSNKFTFAASQNGYYTTGYGAGTSPSYPTECNTSGVLTIDANKQTWTLTTETRSETMEGTYAAFTAPVSLYLFACNTNGSTGYGTVSIYSCRIYDNGVIVRNFVPCKNASGVVGMYDTVNGLFYSNMGSGTFSPGPEIAPSYKVVDANDLDSAIEASADALRSKCKVVDKMDWSMHDGFSSIIAAITGGSSGGSSGGEQIAEGTFEYNALKSIKDNPLIVSGLGFEPTKVFVFGDMCNSEGIVNIDSVTGTYTAYWSEESEYEDDEGETYYEYDYHVQTYAMADRGLSLTLNSDGFTISAEHTGYDADLYWAMYATYRYIVIG